MIQLSNLEQEIFSSLLRRAIKIDPNIVLRVTGGWVRDKLLGKDPVDIDISVDGISAIDFAQWGDDYGLPVVLECRPEQGKNVETVITKCYGHTIDITAVQENAIIDAGRRDLTINALFFNLNTNKVEDYSGYALKDLSDKIARTPIEPLQTFEDDPLRVLRCIRFICEYDLEPEINLVEAIKSARIKYLFQTKITVERVWTELVKLMIGKNPVRALKLLAEYGYRDILFVPEEGLNSWDKDQCSLHHDLDIWSHTVTALEYLLQHEDKQTPENSLIRNLAALFHDIGKCDPNFIQQHPDGIHLQYKEHEIGSAKITEQALTKLNAPTNIKDRVVKLVRQHMRLHHMEVDASDKVLRRFLRDLDDQWINSVDIAIADVYGKVASVGNLSLADKYNGFKSRMDKLLLEQDNNTKPTRPINGHELMQIFDLKPGPALGRIFAQLDEKLLELPFMSKDEAIQFVKELNLC